MGELVRGATLRLWNLQVQKKDRIRDPEKFWHMPWDKETPTTAEIVKQIGSLSSNDRDKMAQEFVKRTELKNGKQ